MFLGKLEGVDKPQHFIHIAAYRHVVDCLMLDSTLPVNEKRGSKRNTGIKVLDTVSRSNLMLYTRDNWKLHGTDTALFARCVSPHIEGEHLKIPE